jgi:hypothetical protein
MAARIEIIPSRNFSCFTESFPLPGPARTIAAINGS